MKKKDFKIKLKMILLEKCNLGTLVDQSYKVDKDILKFVLYQNIWGYYHS